MEQHILAPALARNGDNVSLTARVLGSRREKLRYGLQKHGLRNGSIITLTCLFVVLLVVDLVLKASD